MPVLQTGLAKSAAEDYTIDQSLRFNDGDSAYLSRTPGSAGNRRTWTFSAWVKVANLGTSRGIFSAGTASSTHTHISFTTANQIEWTYYPGSVTYQRVTTAKYRDAGGWMHIVATQDTTDSTEADRLKLWVNGVQVTDWVTNSQSALNVEADINNTVEHTVGKQMYSPQYYDGYLAEVYLIDGTALTPASFGETDTATNQWKPIDASDLTFGTNGFYQKYSSTELAASFEDSSSSDHTITANGDVTNTRAQSKVGDSSIYFQGSADYLSTPDSSDWALGTTFTIEAWIRMDSSPTNTGQQTIWAQQDSTSDRFAIWINGATQVAQVQIDDTAQIGGVDVGLSFDTWHHIALVFDGTDATWYTDGVEQTTGTIAVVGGMPDMSAAVNIGYQVSGNSYQGYMDEIRVSDSARYTANFTPSTTAFTADSNTKLLIHSDFDGGLGADSSGNENDFAVTNLVATDQMVDSPTNNFATLSPIAANDDGLSCTILTEGNLKIPPSSSATRHVRGATIDNSSLDDEKWYYEIYVGAADSFTVGYRNAQDGDDTPSVEFEQDGQYKVDSGNSGSATGTISDGDILGVLLDWSDTSAKTFAIYVNNSLVGSAKTFTANANGYNLYGRGSDASGNGGNLVYNFGSDSSFAGNKTAQGNQDSNGIGDFYYEPPTDYLALCSSNLPSPEIALPTAHFSTKLYTGDGATTLAVTGVGFQPDFTWIKNRDQTDDHTLVDSVRGATNYLVSNDTDIEVDDSTFVASLDSDGFTVGDDVVVNTNTENYASWNWLAGGTAASNTDGTITSSVSANPTAGFSIIKYTGTTSNATIGHGLSAAPELVIIKGLDSVLDWFVNDPSATPFTKYMKLDTDGSSGSSSTMYQDTAPNASVVTLGTSSLVNAAEDFIMYCFHSVEGYSKVGSYTGNGDTDGPFTYIGFKPAFIMVKLATAAYGSWVMFDNKRDPYNPTGRVFYADIAAISTDVSSYHPYDLLSNGFKSRITGGDGNEASYNSDGETYIYLAFAESPFKYSNAR